MSDTNNGGTAFPSQPTFHFPSGITGFTANEGMSLRDYFAAKAMQAIYIKNIDHDSGEAPDEASAEVEREIADSAYRMADLMIARREAK